MNKKELIERIKKLQSCADLMLLKDEILTHLEDKKKKKGDE